MADGTASLPTDPIEEALRNYYSTNGFSLSGIDLFCLGTTRASKALTLMLTMVSGATHSESGRSPFSRVFIAYGVDDGATANFFYTTTERLRVTDLDCSSR